MKRRLGVTLIELLVVIAIIGLILAGAVRALAAGLDTERRLREGATQAQRIAALEEEVRGWIERAWLSSDANDPASFLIGDVATGQPGEATQLQGGIQQGQGAQGAASDQLTFTAAGLRLPGTLLASQDDFETNNENLGPQGGVAEMSLSIVPFDAPEGQTGLFLREQRPADGDPTQGGTQRVVSPDVTQISFEFWDGLEWRPDWDTRSSTPDRLPAAIRVTYRLTDEEQDRIFTVRLPNSDVTAANPVAAGGGQAP